MLHACTQSLDDFAAGTSMNALAEEMGFLVLYPAPVQSANAQKCWNWFSATDQKPGQGEPSLIAGMTRKVMAEHGVDPARVYIAGLSASGATAAIMGQAYPELYAAIGVHSGLAYGAARDIPTAFIAMRQGAAGAGGEARPVPTIVFHADRDTTVHPSNGDAVIAQFMAAGLRKEMREGRVSGGPAMPIAAPSMPMRPGGLWWSNGSCRAVAMPGRAAARRAAIRMRRGRMPRAK